jgi:hypothetical protein
MNRKNFVARYFKCLSFDGDYVEKQWNGSVVKNNLFLQELKIKNPNCMHCNLIVCLAVVETSMFDNGLGILKFLNVI